MHPVLSTAITKIRLSKMILTERTETALIFSVYQNNICLCSFNHTAVASCLPLCPMLTARASLDSSPFLGCEFRQMTHCGVILHWRISHVDTTGNFPR
jgi:hypothetical protein